MTSDEAFSQVNPSSLSRSDWGTSGGDNVARIGSEFAACVLVKANRLAGIQTMPKGPSARPRLMIGFCVVDLWWGWGWANKWWRVIVNSWLMYGTKAR